MVQLRIGGALFNKRAKATTASDMPVLPINNPEGKYSTGGAEEAYPYVILPIEFQAQKHVNMCGDSCVNMLYSFPHKTPPNNLKVNPRGVFDGMDTEDISKMFGEGTGALKQWQPLWRKPGGNFADLTQSRLAYALNTFGPLMWSGTFVRFIGKLRGGHWIIVHGIVGDTVLIADPWHGEDRKKPFSWFKEHISPDKDDKPFYVGA